MYKVSVIVPVYNVERYLDRCLTSIINQTYKNLEIILVNDGSTDNSREIAKGYTTLDNRVKLYDKQKGKNLICLIGIIGLVVVDGFIETMLIDPFIAVIFICLFNLMNLDSLSKKIWNFFGTHSTNMWLTHMLFYMTFAEEFVFASRNVLVIFLVLVGLSVISSYLINMIYKPIIREINNKLYATNINYLRQNA